MLPVRWRLALWNSLVLAAVLFVSGAIAWTLVIQALEHQLDDSLTSKAADLTAAATRQPAFPRLVFLPNVSNFTSSETLLQLISDDGRLLDRSPNLGRETLPWDAEILVDAVNGTPTFTTREVAGEPVRIYTAPLQLGGLTVAVLQVARPTSELDETKRLLALALLGSGAGGLLLALGLGWWLAGLALAPVRRVTQTAREIAMSGEPDRRLAYRGSNDELGALSGTFNTMLDRLSTVIAAQRRFVADASHELRTPMTTLRLNIHSLLRDPCGDPVERGSVLTEMADETDRLSRLVSGLLELARADAGRQPSRDRVRLDEVVREAAHNLEALSGGRMCLEPVEPVELPGSRDGLRQVVLILLDNAIKYSSPHAPISVSLVADQIARQAVFSVADQGLGISPQDLPHLFERFYRAVGVRQTSGTGLGLAIARTIVEEHGGTITASSEVGRGATFRVTLPFSDRPAPRADAGDGLHAQAVGAVR